jgi:HSP90 family molecular chaperone
MYPEKTHFIYELLQNAEDAGAKRVKFIQSSDCLE